MPEIRYYRVTQTREVEVTANSVVDAIRIADSAFDKGQYTSDASIKPNEELAGIWGNTTTRVRIIDTQAREKGR